MCFGLLYLNDGLNENGERILFEDWVKYINIFFEVFLNRKGYGV